MEEESNAELVFLDTLLNIIMERSLYWYVGSLRILTNNCNTALTTKQVARKLLLHHCLIEYIPLSQIKITYTKENGYQESIISKNF